jgi:hypothetical protein
LNLKYLSYDLKHLLRQLPLFLKNHLSQMYLNFYLKLKHLLYLLYLLILKNLMFLKSHYLHLNHEYQLFL